MPAATNIYRLLNGLHGTLLHDDDELKQIFREMEACDLFKMYLLHQTQTF